MTQLSVKLFGLFDGEIGRKKLRKFRTTKVQALLIYLIVEQPHATRRELLLDLLWPGLPQKSAQVNLRQILYQLRKALDSVEGDVFVREQRSVRLADGVLDSADIHTFDQLLAANAAHDHSDIRSCTECRERLEQAVALYAGPFMDGFYIGDSNVFEEWLGSRRAAYERQFFDALSLLTTIYLRNGRYADAAQSARQQLKHDNLRESGHRQLMEALANSGQRESALAQYNECRILLDEELGMSPTQRTIQLADHIVAGDLELATVAQTPELRGYELLEKLGSGAYGDVHRAYQPLINREVAVKIIKPEYANRSDFIRRFEIEAQTIAQLEHPYIVPLYDYWREPNGAFLIMRYLRGGNLEQAIGARGAWRVTEVARVAAQVGAALAAAHEQGVVHRDLKPANILLDAEGNVFLSDFGIARRIVEDGLQPAREPNSAAMLTSSPYYTSPEQLSGQLVTARSDIYTFGLLIFELLTGSKPFSELSLGAMLKKRLDSQLPSVSEHVDELPAAVDAVLQQASATDPADRYEDVETFVHELHVALTGQELAAASHAPLTKQIDGNPYKGLRAFQESDATLFFGRNQLIDQLTSHLADSRFLAVVGPSGSGKSSVVKAGLLPALRNDTVDGASRWFMTEMVPSAHPLEELEAALLRVAVEPPASLLEPLQKDERGLVRVLKRILPPPSDNRGQPTQLLLVIDQFEELFTLTHEERRQHFIDNLVAALNEVQSQLRVVITLRADFYDRPLQLPELADFIQAHNVVVTPLNREELEESIMRPAALAGVRFEAGLVSEIVDDVRGQPGMLPLLQYALTELFERRAGNQLTREAYTELGGIQGVLGQRAEEIFGSLSAENQPLAKQLFLRLVTLGEGSEDTRRRVLQLELESLGGGEKQLTENSQQSTNNLTPFSLLLAPFGEARLLSFDRDPATRMPTVEVAHEALLREWPRLREWLNESRDDLRLQRRLGVLSAEYTQSNADPSFLLRGGQLQQFEEWATATKVVLTSDEQQYLDASIASRTTQHAEEETRRQRELEQAQKLVETERQRAEDQTTAASSLRQRAYLLAGALAVAAILAVTAFISSNRATENANLAATQEAQAIANAALASTRESEAQELAQIAQENSDLAAANEAQAVEAQANAEAQARLATANELAARSADAISKDAELATLLALKSLDVAQTSDGETSLHRALQANRLLDSYTLQESWNYTYAESVYYDAETNSAVIWDIEQRTILYEIEKFVQWAYLSSTEDRILLGYCEDNSADKCEQVVVDLESGILSDHPFSSVVNRDRDEIVEWWMTPDFSHWVWFHADGLIELQNAFTKETILLEGHTSSNIAIAFDQGSKWMVTSDSDGQIILWDLATTIETEVSTIKARWTDSVGTSFLWTNAILEVEDNLLVAVLGEDAFTSKVWRVEEQSAELLLETTGHSNFVSTVQFSSDGKLFASAGSDGVVKLVDLDLNEEVLELNNQSGVNSVEFFKENQSLRTSLESGEIRHWNISTIPHEVRPVAQLPSIATSARLSPDESLLAVGNNFSPLSIINIESGEVVMQAPDNINGTRAAAFFPDGNRFAAAGHDGFVRIWDVSTQQLQAEWKAHEVDYSQTTGAFWHGIWTIDVSPDGKLLATGTNNVGAGVWNSEDGSLVFPLFEGEFGRVWRAMFHPTADQIAVRGQSQVRVYDTNSGKEVWRIDSISGTGLAYSPDGRKLALTSDLGQFLVLDSQTGTMLYETGSLTGFSDSVAFTADNRFILTNDQDGISVWDANNGEFEFALTDNASGNITITNDNRLFTVGFQSGQVAEYTVLADDALALASERVTREMTEQECLQYLRNADCEVSFGDG